MCDNLLCESVVGDALGAVCGGHVAAASALRFVGLQISGKPVSHDSGATQTCRGAVVLAGSGGLCGMPVPRWDAGGMVDVCEV